MGNYGSNRHNRQPLQVAKSMSMGIPVGKSVGVSPYDAPGTKGRTMPAKPARTPNKEAANLIYQLKVTLKDSKPPIWRRIQVPASTTLVKLHRVL